MNAQTGGHPTIAELAPGAAYPTNPNKTSPYWNKVNGWWDKGEAYLPPDIPDSGGVLGPDPAASNAPTYLTDFLGGWQPFQSTLSTNLQHWVGEMRGVPSVNPLPQHVASLEIVGRGDLNLENRKPYAVVVLVVPPTHGTFTPDQAPFAYPGNSSNYGLWTGQTPAGVWFGYTWPGADRVAEHYRVNPASDYDVFSAYAVERASARPLVFTMQRYRQLRHVVAERLFQDFGYSKTNIAFLVAGSSYGGLPAQLLPMMYPDEFHAGLSSAFTPQMRGLVNDQDSFDFATTLRGVAHSGAGYALLDAMDWTIFCRTEGTDYLGMSTMNRLALNRQAGGGQVLRPLYLLCADADLVTHGNDWVGLLLGWTPNAGSQRWAGQYTTQGRLPVNIYWSVVGKSCHGDVAWAEPIYIWPNTNPAQPNNTHDLFETVPPMVQEARDQVSFAMDSAMRPPRLVPQSSLINTLTPHDHVLNRRDVRQAPTSPSRHQVLS